MIHRQIRFICLYSAILAACPLDTFGVGEPELASSGGATGGTGTGTTEVGESFGSTPTAGGDEVSGYAPETTLLLPGCGDGVVQDGEACDEGAANGADSACTPMCTTPVCGDGFVWAAEEECDDGNGDPGDTCVGCRHARCGDGALWAGVETCDDMGESATCDVDCTPMLCGDGVINDAAGEVCDDGALNGPYGGACNTTCEGLSGVCGDMVIDVGHETCDGGAVTNGSCSDVCQMSCASPYDDCDGDPANGCEASLMSDEHCGSCSKKCTGLWQCGGNGTCQKA